MISVSALTARLDAYKPRRLPGRRLVSRCGVIVLIADHDAQGNPMAPAVLMMKRAERPGDPWSGHVSFPGGRVDKADASTRAAALRELTEETGFEPAEQITPVGRLSDLLTREHGRPRPMVVSPYVYRTHNAVELQPSKEAAELWWVPLSHLVPKASRKKMVWRIRGLPLPVSYIDLGSAKLWGLTLMMTDELIRAGGLDNRT